jgi:hypothetical protein
MRTFTITELKKDTAVVLDSMSQDGYTLITQNGKPKSIMLNLRDGDDLELWLRDVRYMRARNAVESSREDARRSGKDSMSMDEINEIIAQYRKEKRELGEAVC